MERVLRQPVSLWRAWWWRVLLVFTLLFGQVAGFAHALTHLKLEPASQSTDKGLKQHHTVCDLCSAYDALGNAPAASAFVLPVQSLAQPMFGLLLLGCFATFVLPYRSRGPPLLN